MIDHRSYAHSFSSWDLIKAWKQFRTRWDSAIPVQCSTNCVIKTTEKKAENKKNIIPVIHTSLAVNVILLRLRWSIMASYLSTHLKYMIIRIFIYIFHLRRVDSLITSTHPDGLIAPLKEYCTGQYWCGHGLKSRSGPGFFQALIS